MINPPKDSGGDSLPSLLTVALATLWLSASYRQAAAIGLGTAVTITPETGMTWTVQSALSPATITVASSTLTMDSIGLSVNRAGDTLTGKLYKWDATNLTFALNGSGTYSVTLMGLEMGENWFLYRDGAYVGNYDTYGTGTVTITCQTGSEHTFSFVKFTWGSSQQPSGGTGTVNPAGPNTFSPTPEIVPPRLSAIVIVVILSVGVMALIPTRRRRRRR